MIKCCRELLWWRSWGQGSGSFRSHEVVLQVQVLKRDVVMKGKGQGFLVDASLMELHLRFRRTREVLNRRDSTVCMSPKVTDVVQ